MAPVLIGLFIFTAADAIGPASGGSFNPARSLDPVIYNWDFGNVSTGDLRFYFSAGARTTAGALAPAERETPG
jgi:glycerol uptake facilitator-like aquaporin